MSALRSALRGPSNPLATLRRSIPRPPDAAPSSPQCARFRPCPPNACHTRRAFSHTASRDFFRRRDHDPHEALRTARPLFTNEGMRRTARSPRTHTVALVAVAAAVLFYFSNIQTVPVSGRRRFNCFSDDAVVALSEQQVKQIEYEVKQQGGRFLPEWDPRTRLVKRVMARLIPVSGGGEAPKAVAAAQHDAGGEPWQGQWREDGAESWPGENNSKGGGNDVDWEIRVIDDPRTMNAFVLPGGKVFVHSGILRATRSEAGLAAVLGHEMAHNMASHVGERMSGAIGINILLYSVYFLSFAVPGGIFLAHTLGGSLMDMLFAWPMNRMQESEADYIGLMLMAEACYDPREAVRFWQRMDTMGRAEGGEPPELMSTHPSNHNRMEKIESWLPEAIEKWNASSCGGTSSFADAFRRALERGTMMGG